MCYKKAMRCLRRWSLASLSFILGSVLLFYIVFSDQCLARFYYLHRTENLLLQANERKRGEINELKSEIGRLQKLPYLERVAREELGFLRSNEIVYYVETPNTKAND